MLHLLKLLLLLKIGSLRLKRCICGPASGVRNRIELASVLWVVVLSYHGAFCSVSSKALSFHFIVLHELVCTDMLYTFLLQDVLAHILECLVYPFIHLKEVVKIC